MIHNSLIMSHYDESLRYALFLNDPEDIEKIQCTNFIEFKTEQR